MGINSNYLEISFSLFFLGIEKIIDMYFPKRKIISDNIFNKLEKKIKELISNYYSGDNENEKLSNCEIEKIIEKIPELNRQAFKPLLFRLLKELNINYKKLYPPNSEFTLLSTRNKTIHKAKEIEFDKFWNENMRARIILENLIIKLLGWEGDYKSPRSWEIKFLMEK